MDQITPYVIFTAATADLPAEEFLKHEIHVLPMSYKLSGQDVLYEGGWSDERFHAFYDRLRAESGFDIPDHAGRLENLSRLGWKRHDILFVCFASGLSGSYQSRASLRRF
jgi:fatty acid-binding protein DegV